MAAQITEAVGCEPELIAGDNGIFNVEVDGKLIFSKDKTGRFPEDEEILTELR